MENLIAYLDKSLVPLDDKVQEYLQAEHDIHQLEAEILTLNHPELAPTTKGHAENQHQLQEKQQQLQALIKQYNVLKEELIGMLPERNKYVEINLGYGPSMVGYFDIDPDTRTPLQEPVLRVVH